MQTPRPLPSPYPRGRGLMMLTDVWCSSTLVSELRTSSLGPKQYYELYMAVFDALRHLSVFLRESHPVNHLADLYELVQYAGTTCRQNNILGSTRGYKNRR